MQDIGNGKHGVVIEKNRSKLRVVIYPVDGYKTNIRLTPNEAVDLLAFLQKNKGIIQAAAQYENYMHGEIN